MGEPPPDRLELTLLRDPAGVFRDQLTGPGVRSGGDGVADRRADVTPRLPGLAGAVVECTQMVLIACREVGSEQVGEHRMEATAVPVSVQIDNEEVGGTASLEQSDAVVGLPDLVAQLRIEPLQDGDVQQEVPQILGLAVEHLAEEVARHQLIVPGESFDEAARIVDVGDREEGETQSTGPSLGAAGEQFDVVLVQVRRSHQVDQLRHLVPSEAQIPGIDLGQPPVGAPPVEPPGRFGPGQEDEVLGRAEPFGHVVAPLERPRFIEHVEVVDDHQGMIREIGEPVRERGQPAVGRHRVVRDCRGQIGGRHAERLDRGQQITPEHTWIVETVVDGQPRGSAVPTPWRSQPLDDQGGLPRRRLTGHHRDGRSDRRVETIDQTRPLEQHPGRDGDVKECLSE